MIRTIRLLLLLAIALMTIQCGRHHYSPELALLDSLADTKVDSAVVLMRRISPRFANASEWDRRYYQLLSIKIADKADLPLPSDTIAWELVRYYEEEGDERLLPLAYYYGARICRSHNDAPQALDYLLRANDLLPDNSQLRLKAVVNSQMGYLFSQQKLYRNAIEAFKRAYYCDSIIRDTTGLIYNLRDIGFDYENVGIRDSSIFFFQKAILLASVQKNDEMIFTMKTNIASLLHLLGKNDEALTLIKDVITYNDKSSQSATFSVAADVYQALGMTDSAVVCYQKLISLPFIYAQRKGYGGLSGYYANNEMHKQAHFYYEKYRMCSDSIDKITAINTIAQMNSLYNYQLREKENEQLKDDIARKNRNVFIASIIAISIIAFLSISYYRMRNRDIKLKANLEKLRRLQEEAKLKNEKHINENLITIENLKKHISKLDIQDQKQKGELELLKEKLEYTTKLAIIAQKEEKDTLLKLEETPIYQLIKESNGMPKEKVRCLTDNEWDELSNAIDQSYPDFKKQLFSFYPIKMHEYHICMLIKLKIPPIIIASLTAHSKESITATRRRLYYKSFGKEGSPKDWDNFVLSI